MLDPVLRRWVDPPLNRAGAWLAAARRAGQRDQHRRPWRSACSRVPLLACGCYGAALLVILLNRLIDGLDGAIARQGRPTPFGGYLDIVCDMAFYAAVPLGFALASPANALWAALLLASFVCTAASFLGRAVMAAQRGEADDGARGGSRSSTPPASSRAPRPSWPSFCSACFPSAFPWLAGLLRRPVLLDGCGPLARGLAVRARRRALTKYCRSR